MKTADETTKGRAMTQPTIEQMDVEEFINHLESTCVVLTDEPEVIPKFLAKPPRYYSFRVSEAEQMLEQFVSARIRAALAEKQGVDRSLSIARDALTAIMVLKPGSPEAAIKQCAFVSKLAKEALAALAAQREG